MLQSLKTIKSRIKSIENTKKLTRAMEMISVAKLKPVQTGLYAWRQYHTKMESLLKNILAGAKLIPHPLVTERQEKNNTTLCLITSDTGLCAGYNNNLIHSAEQFIEQHRASGLSLFTIGRKGGNYFKKRKVPIVGEYNEFGGRYSDSAFNAIYKDLTSFYLSGQADEVYILYTHFESVSRLRPWVEKFLNIELTLGPGLEYLFEPDAQTIFNALVPEYLSSKLRGILLDAFTAEHSARIVAMGEATDNAEELVENLVLLRNKVRQANITREIMEIISSAEALRG